MDHPIEVLSSVLEMAKAWRKANGPITKVRNIREHNEDTIVRVCDDYQRVEDILGRYLDFKGRDQLRDRSTQTLPTILEKLLEEYRGSKERLEEENKQLRAKLATARTHLTTIGEWDCLNPPQKKLLSDLPWLRKVVDDALTSIGSADT